MKSTGISRVNTENSLDKNICSILNENKDTPNCTKPMNYFKILKIRKAEVDVEIFCFSKNKSRLNNNKKEKNKVQFNSMDFTLA